MAGLLPYGLQVEDAKRKAQEQAQKRTEYVKNLRQNRPDFSPELINKFADSVAPMGQNFIVQPKQTDKLNFAEEKPAETTATEQPQLGLTKAAQSAPTATQGQGIVYQRGFTPNPADDIGNALKRTDSKGISFAPDTPIASQEPQLGFVNINARPSQAEMEQRQKLIKQALTPIAGARGITANQMRMAQSLMEEPQKRQADLAKTQANINAGLQKAAMEAQQARQRQALEMARFGLQRQDALNAQARQDALQAKADERYETEKAQNDTLFGLKKQGLEMQNEQARLGLNALQQAEEAKNEYYNAKTPEEQEKAYNKMKRLGLVAKEDKGTFQKTKIMMTDANGMLVEQEVFYNPVTGETRSPLEFNAANKKGKNRSLDDEVEF